MSPVRTTFCAFVKRLLGGVATPRKNGLNCTIPAPLNSSDSSNRPVTSYGISEPEGYWLCPFDSKNWRYFWRSSRAVILKEGTHRHLSMALCPRPHHLLHTGRLHAPEQKPSERY